MITKHTLRVPAAASLALMLVAACGGGGDGGDQQPPPVEQPPETFDLAALAASADVQARNLPFGAIPRADEARHLTGSDGTRLAVDIYYPAGLDRGAGQAPAMYIESWYGRRSEAVMNAIELYRAGGFVVVVGDARGFGASFGAQTSFISARARQDQREVLAWVAAQPWSNGATAVAGISLSASFAEVMAASGAPSLKAAIIRAEDFDHYQDNLFPGGVPNRNMIEGVVGLTMFGVRGGPCVEHAAACAQLPGDVYPPVDGDDDRSLLRAAVLERRASFDTTGLMQVEFDDDQVGGAGFGEMSAVGYLDGLRAAALPARVSASWIDGLTARGALQRFAALPGVPMEVVIGSTTHSGGLDTDPLARQPFRPARPGAAEQFAGDVAFVRRALAGEPIGRSVSYLVHGTDTWKTTPVWPPAGVEARTLRFDGGALVASAAVQPGSVGYTVDPAASSGGPFTRWGSQRNQPVFYGDRRLAAGRRLSFDSAPMTGDTELVGEPELCLAMTTDQSDGIVIAYLEDVAPEGRVSYLTEGQLRLVHRRTEGAACDPAPGSRRSFARADASPVVPGQAMRFELPLLPTAALVKKGHRLRVSLAGADAGTFAPLTEAPASWVLAYGGAQGSTLTIPVRPWTPAR
jgi:uncharacterized protein